MILKIKIKDIFIKKVNSKWVLFTYIHNKLFAITYALTYNAIRNHYKITKSIYPEMFAFNMYNNKIEIYQPGGWYYQRCIGS